MNMQQVQEILHKGFTDLTGEVIIKPCTKLNNCDRFDDLDRVEFVMLAEDYFNIELDALEDEKLTTFGAFVITVWKKIKENRCG